MKNPRFAFALLVSITSLAATPQLGCGGSDDDPAAPDAQLNEDLDMKAEDFECILNWPKVNRYRITNKLGHLDEALAIARNPDGGGAYPVGTVIQLVPFEAMVKRRRGFNAETADWEFFNLEDSKQGTQIVSRGGGEIINKINQKSCLGCHSATEARFDLVCETTHGCEPLGAVVTPELIESVQKADKRCP